MSQLHDFAKKTHKKVFKLFDYISDDVQYNAVEHWTSHAAKVKRGERFSDDCDGFALTCAELLLDDVARSLVSIVYCITENGEGHLVCAVDDEWILDNRYPYVYHWKDTAYKWDRFMRMDNLGRWKKVE